MNSKDYVLSVRIKNDKEGPQTGDVVLNGSAINEYLEGAEYEAGDVVVYNNQFYQSLEDQIASASFDYDKWTQIGIPDIIIPEFQTNTYYKKDQVVSYNGKLYKAKEDFTSSIAFYDTDWDSLTGETYEFTSEDRTVVITINDSTIDFSVSDYVDNVKTNLENQLDNKVDKEDGKGLSTNDYTSTEKTKLLNLAEIFSIGDNLVLDADGKLNAGFSVSFDASLDKTSTNGVQNKAIAEAVEALQNKDDQQDILIQNNKTQSDTNKADIVTIKNDISDIKDHLDDEGAALNTKVDKVDGKELSSNDYTDADQTKVTNLAKIYNIGARLTLDPNTNTLSADDQSITLEPTTGTSTTSGMTQAAITQAIADAVAGGTSSLATVATSGSYNDLIDTPTVDTALSTTSTNAVTNSAITTEMNKKANSDDLALVATSGSYNDLNDKPTIPSKVTDLTDASDYAKNDDLATVATTGSYNDLTDKPGSSIEAITDYFYPVGSYYETSDTDFDPNVSWSGTWVLDSQGRVTVSQDSSNFSILGTTGGNLNHTITNDNIPRGLISVAHIANMEGEFYSEGIVTKGRGSGLQIEGATSSQSYTTYGHTYTFGKSSPTAISNLQPYVVVKRWHRTE